MLKIITVTYQAKDGKIFDKEEDCVEYENHLTKPKCNVCDGAGRLIAGDGHDCWGKHETYTETCPVCKGTGVQEKDYNERLDKYHKYLELKNMFE